MNTGDRMTVGLIAPSLRLIGGHAVQAQRLIEGWRSDAEIQVRLVPINPEPPRLLRWLTRIKFVRTVVTQLCYWPLLVRELRHADVVHVFSTSNSSFFVSVVPAVLVARLYRKPVIVNYRGDSREHLAKSAVARRVLKAVDLNVVPSAYFQSLFLDLGIPAQIIANVADLTRFEYRVRNPLQPRLLSTRNFEPIYNVASTLRAFARVQASYPEASLVLVGGGSEERRLRVLAARLGLRNVTFAGRVPHAEIHRFYAAASIYVQTPVVDNMPGSVIEAFASGLPVVSTRVGGIPVILQDGAHGLLAPHNDDAAVAAHVITLLQNQEQARQLAAAAFASCSEYDWPLVREQWRSIYRAVTSVRHVRARWEGGCGEGVGP
jgi:glycosyltransferase involved in cell wall biosynthesis